MYVIPLYLCSIINNSTFHFISCSCCVVLLLGYPAKTGTGTLIITLMDVNDNFPTFANDYRPVIYENQDPGVTVVTISAVDRDMASNGPPFEFRLPCRGACPCTENPTCSDFAFRFIPGKFEIEYFDV